MILKLLYQIVISLTVPLALLRLVIRSRKNPQIRQHFGERLGSNVPTCSKPVIWIHAVSLGETVAVSPLIQRLINQMPQYQVVLTNTTLTGRNKGQSLFGDQIISRYLPYDAPWIMPAFIDRLNPALVVIVETELWPNMLARLKQRGTPVMMANARMNARSARRYAKSGELGREMLSALSKLAVQTESDLAEFKALGLENQHMALTGNLKFEQQLPGDKVAVGKQWQQQFQRPVWVAASTHDQEEQIILQAHRQLTANIPQLLLILVPRHPERFQQVADLIQKRQFSYCRHSESVLPDEHTQVWLGDTMGNMFSYYAAADLAFVGGSLVPVGGHSPVEPAALGLPVLMGPNVHKCQQVHDELRQKGALVSVNSESLAIAVKTLMENDQAREQAGLVAKDWVAHNQGATQKHLDMIAELLG